MKGARSTHNLVILAKAQGCAAKSWGGEGKEIASPISSWPGSARPSTPWGGRDKDVDGRIKSAQGDLKSFPAGLAQVPLSRKFSPDSPARKWESTWISGCGFRLSTSLRPE